MKWFFVFAMALFSACSSIPTNLEQPKVDLQKVDVTNSDFSKAQLVFNFLVHNPNSVPIAVDQVDYALKLNDKPFTKGVLDQGLKVGANSSVVVPLPIQVSYSDLASSLSSFLQQGSSKYQIEGEVKLGLFSIPFSENGEVKLSDLQK